MHLMNSLVKPNLLKVAANVSARSFCSAVLEGDFTKNADLAGKPSFVATATATDTFIRSITPQPANDWTAVFSYAFDALHFSHVVLNRKMEILDFSNRRWTLEGVENCFCGDDNDRSLENGLGTFKKISTVTLRHMIERTTQRALPLTNDVILTEQYTGSYDDKAKKVKDIVTASIVRGLLYETMVNRRISDANNNQSELMKVDENRNGTLLTARDLVYEIDSAVLNKFFNMQILSKNKERLLIDEKKACEILARLQRKPRLPENFFSASTPEVNSQTLIGALLRAVAFVTCFDFSHNTHDAVRCGVHNRASDADDVDFIEEDVLPNHLLHSERMFLVN